MQKIFVVMATAIIVLLAFKSPTQFVVTGKITDDAGQRLSGVSVSVKGTKTIVQSDMYGSFSITLLAWLC